MSVTALDPLTALIVVDLQQGIIGSRLIHPIAEVVKPALSSKRFGGMSCLSFSLTLRAERQAERNNRDVPRHYPKDGPI